MSAFEIIILLMMLNVLMAFFAGIATAGHLGPSLTLGIISWIIAIVTAAMIVLSSVTFSSLTLFGVCLTIVLRQGIVLITSAIVNGKVKKDIPKYFNGIWLFSTGLIGTIGVFALFVAGISSLLRITGIIAT